jgi:signal transduction histidine kinase
MTLRRGFSAAMYALLAALLAVPVIFISITSIMNHRAEDLGETVDGVRMMQKSQLDLLLHARSRDDFIREELAGQLLSDIDNIQAYVNGPREEEAYRKAQDAVNTYLHASGGPNRTAAPLQDAYRALENMVRINVSDADHAQKAVRKWNRLGDVLGIGFAVSFISIVLALLYWVRAQVIGPILSTSGALEAFRRGNRRSRSPVDGPEEVATIARRFNDMAEEIEGERDRLQTYLGSVAHDLRNPLAALKLSTSKRMAEEGVPREKLVSTLSLVRTQVERLDRMIDDLVDATRIEAGELEIRKVRTDACVLAEEVVQLFAATSPHHKLKLDCPGKAVLLDADPSRLAQVLNNLVSNAIKYSPDGGEVIVQVREADDEVVFCVSDEGIGMSEKELEEIFQPFRRVGVSRESIPGVGLGLFAVRRIVEAHRGEVSVDSTPGKGSIFEVRLPKRSLPGHVSAEDEKPSVH